MFAAAVSLYSHVSISDSSVLTAMLERSLPDHVTSLVAMAPAPLEEKFKQAGIVTTPCGVNPLICPHYVAYLFPVYANEMHM